MTAAIRRSVAQALHALSDGCSSLANRLVEHRAEAEHNQARLNFSLDNVGGRVGRQRRVGLPRRKGLAVQVMENRDRRW
jgi:phage shock protein A